MRYCSTPTFPLAALHLLCSNLLSIPADCLRITAGTPPRPTPPPRGRCAIPALPSELRSDMYDLIVASSEIAVKGADFIEFTGLALGQINKQIRSQYLPRPPRFRPHREARGSNSTLQATGSNLYESSLMRSSPSPAKVNTPSASSSSSTHLHASPQEVVRAGTSSAPVCEHSSACV